MKTWRTIKVSPLSIVSLLLLSILLAACGGVSGESWAGISADPKQDLLYVSYDKRVTALDPASGDTVWQYPPKDDQDAQFFAVPVVDNGTLYIGDYKGRLHAVSTADGKKQWVYQPAKEKILGLISITQRDRIISGVAVDAERVYFGLGSRNVVAVSRETAEEVWTFETDHGVWATPLYIPANPDDPDSRATLYVASLDHFLYALDPATGEKLWSKDLGGAAPGNMLYDPDFNRLYVGTFLSELLAIDLATHEIVDRYETEGWLWGGPAREIADGGEEILYFGDLLGYVYAVRVTETGFEQVWKQEIAQDAVRGTPLVTANRIFVGSKDKHLYALDKADGSAKWDKQTKGEILTEIVLVPGRGDEPAQVIVGTSEKKQLVLAYTTDTGNEKWHYKY